VIAGIRQYLGGWPGMFLLRSVYVRIGEGSLAEHLNAMLEEFPELMCGSYPEFSNPEYRMHDPGVQGARLPGARPPLSPRPAPARRRRPGRL